MRVIWERWVSKFSFRWHQNIGTILIFTFTSAIFAQTSISPPPTNNSYQIKLSYWNDNFGYQGAIRDIIPPGKDDGVTAAFRVQYSLTHGLHTTNLDIYYAILTNRPQDYRTDLIAVRVTDEKHLRWGYFMAGLGCISNGNFGGADLQNWYHKLHGYALVHLNYLNESTAGITATARVRKILWQWHATTLGTYASTSIRSGTATSFIRGAIILNQQLIVPRINTPLHLQLMSGVFHYFATVRVFDPLFQAGMMGGGMASVNVFPHFTVSLWATMNQYGKHSPHYGITLAYQSQKFQPGNLRGVLFP